MIGNEGKKRDGRKRRAKSCYLGAGLNAPLPEVLRTAVL